MATINPILSDSPIYNKSANPHEKANNNLLQDMIIGQNQQANHHL